MRGLLNSEQPGDQKATDGKLYPSSYYPRILGGDHAGVVVEVGSEVTEFSEGDRVEAIPPSFSKIALFLTDSQVTSFTLVQGMPGGSFQDYVIVPAKYAIKIPDHYSFAEAVTTPSSVLTILAIFHEFGWDLPYENITTYVEPVLVWGGGSSLGQAAISLLHLTGYQNIITTASSVHESGLRDRGATHVVDYRSSDVVAKLQLLLGGKPLMKAIDCVSTTETVQQNLPLMSPGSQLAWVLPGELSARSDVNAKFVYAGAFHNAEDANGPLDMTRKIFAMYVPSAQHAPQKLTFCTVCPSCCLPKSTCFLRRHAQIPFLTQSA